MRDAILHPPPTCYFPRNFHVARNLGWIYVDPPVGPTCPTSELSARSRPRQDVRARRPGACPSCACYQRVRVRTRTCAGSDLRSSAVSPQACSFPRATRSLPWRASTLPCSGCARTCASASASRRRAVDRHSLDRFADGGELLAEKRNRGCLRFALFGEERRKRARKLGRTQTDRTDERDSEMAQVVSFGRQDAASPAYRATTRASTRSPFAGGTVCSRKEGDGQDRAAPANLERGP